MSADARLPQYERIARHYRDRIASEQLRAGQRIPTIREVAVEFGVAKQTAHKAIALLRREGLVRTNGRAGTRVHTMPNLRDRIGAALADLAADGRCDCAGIPHPVETILDVVMLAIEGDDDA